MCAKAIYEILAVFFCVSLLLLLFSSFCFRSAFLLSCIIRLGVWGCYSWDAFFVTSGGGTPSFPSSFFLFYTSPALLVNAGLIWKLGGDGWRQEKSFTRQHAYISLVLLCLIFAARLNVRCIKEIELGLVIKTTLNSVVKKSWTWLDVSIAWVMVRRYINLAVSDLVNIWCL